MTAGTEVGGGICLGLGVDERISTDDGGTSSSRSWVVHYGKKVPTPAFSPCHRKRSKIGTEVKLGSTVASMCWVEQPGIETTTSVDILVLNYVVYT